MVAFSLKAPGSGLGGEASLLNTVVFSPQIFARETEEAIQKCVGLQDSLDPQFRSLGFLAILFEVVTGAWIHHCNFMHVLVATKVCILIYYSHQYFDMMFTNL